MSGIFINYRGEDSQTAAVLIDGELKARFGSDLVFLDCRSIPLGADFAEELLSRLRACSVLLVVIGPRWLTLTNADGRRRIDDPHDWIHREIVEALAHGLRVVPVLTDGARLPTDEEVPGDLAGLSRRQGVPLRSRYAEVDLAFLVQRIIAADPELANFAAHSQPSAARPIPRQLPAAPGLFTGRAEELAILTAAVNSAVDARTTVLISAIGGSGGIGKTWLALHWAHRHRDRFPDGQLFVDLQGFSSAGEPIPPAVAVRGFLEALGVEPDRIPLDLHAQAGLFRSLVADRRMLVVLDNAADTAQVTPLLPGTPSCMVLVTSRSRLSGLITGHGAHHVALDVLSETEARALLAARVGAGKADAEPEVMEELVGVCGGLPLALSILAGRAHTNPQLPLAVLVAELREAGVGGWEDMDQAASLPAVFSWSYRALTTEQARVFGLLGIAPGPDIGLPAAAGLTDLTNSEVGVVLRGLEQASLLSRDAAGRYRMHDLVRQFATHRARHDIPRSDQVAALRRVIAFYLHTAHTADRLLYPHRPPIQLNSAEPVCRPLPLDDVTAVLAWFDTEHPCLLAAQHAAANCGWYPLVWQLAWSLDTFHWRLGYRQDRVAAWRAGLAATNKLDDPTTQARVHRLLGHALAHTGRHHEAIEHLSHALNLAEHAHDRFGQGHVHIAFAVLWVQRGDNQLTLEHAAHALHLFRAIDNSLGEASALNLMGWCAIQLGDHDQAHERCQAALALHRSHHNRQGEAITLGNLGYIAFRIGRHTQAVHHYQHALILRRDLGNTFELADTLDRLGHPHAALRQYDYARAAWLEALELYQAQHRHEDAQRVAGQLSELAISQAKRDETDEAE